MEWIMVFKILAFMLGVAVMGWAFIWISVLGSEVETLESSHRMFDTRLRGLEDKVEDIELEL